VFGNSHSSPGSIKLLPQYDGIVVVEVVVDVVVVVDDVVEVVVLVVLVVDIEVVVDVVVLVVVVVVVVVIGIQPSTGSHSSPGCRVQLKRVHPSSSHPLVP